MCIQALMGLNICKYAHTHAYVHTCIINMQHTHEMDKNYANLIY